MQRIYKQTTKVFFFWKIHIVYLPPGQTGESAAGAAWRNNHLISHSWIWMCHLVLSEKIYRHHNAGMMMRGAEGGGWLSGCSCWEQEAEELIIHHATVGKLLDLYAPIGGSANGGCRWESQCAGGQPPVQRRQRSAQSAPPVYCQHWVTEGWHSFSCGPENQLHQSVGILKKNFWILSHYPQIKTL